MSETATQFLCRAAHEHCKASDLVNRLPASLSERSDDLAGAFRTDLGVPSEMRASSSLLSKIFHKVIDYQDRRNHHEPPGMLDNKDQFLAKRIFCEITKDLLRKWSIATNGVDDRVNRAEVQSHVDFIEHLLYFRNLFAGKRHQSATFQTLLVDLDDSLRQLLKHCDQRDTSYCAALDELNDSTLSFADNAARVVLLAVTSNHAELTENLRGEPISLAVLSRTRSKSAPIFWASDYGQVLSAALIRADPETFSPQASVWTDYFKTVSRSDFDSFEDAQASFEETTRKGQCAVLMGPDGQHRDNRKRLTAQRIHETMGVWDRMEEIATQHLLLQHTATSAATAFEEQAGGATQAGVAMIEDLSPEDASVERNCRSLSARSLSSCSYVSDVSSGSKGFADQVGQVQARWMGGNLAQSGISPSFRSKAPQAVLKLPMMLSDYIFAMKLVMGSVRALSSGGSTEMVLVAIRALRNGMQFTKLLMPSIDRFLEVATTVHCTFDAEWRKSVRGRPAIQDQTIEMQQVYFESYRKCMELRKQIRAHWQHLEALISDGVLDDDLKARLQTMSQAHQRLSPTVTTLALQNGLG